MNQKIIIGLAFLGIFAMIPMVNAQDPIEKKASQQLVNIFIDISGEVQVKHIINSSTLSQNLELIIGTISNLKVTNEKGERKDYENITNKNLLILPSQEKTVVEYSLKDALLLEDDYWSWNFRYLETTAFYFPENVELIFVHNRPVFLDDKKGIRCQGCQILIEFPSDKEPRILKNVKWKEKEFIVEIRTFVNIDKFNFDQPSKSISFEADRDDKYVTTLIPLELLWNPYSVFSGDEKVRSYEISKNGTHVWVIMKTSNSSNVTIIGNTVVPEFSLFSPLVVGLFILAVLPIIKKFNLH